MELKDYQSRVLADLAEYLETLESIPNLTDSFKEFWDNRGVTRMEPYKNNVPGVPHVCAKVPTAGGKTFIAVNALDVIFSAFLRRNPKRPKLAVWLVPSLTILEQTVKNLSNPEHPYCKRLNQLFRHRVAVYEKRDLLMGAGFSHDTANEQLSIVVMSFDSLRARNKEDRKIYQENGYLASFVAAPSDAAQDWLLPDLDPSALINVIRGLKPVVVVDESHNAESQLSVEMLVNLNPDFILDLTATPKNNSNIISYVDAMALKKQHMVKLPVIVANRTSRSEVIESALILRRQLEDAALAEEKRGGMYIRPIVLFQAQPKTGEDKTTFERIREKLIELKIPPEQIAIKTAAINELKGVDLLSRGCPVRYIVTVNALKEGWDCPFAYILASLADKTSAVDVEQILGRVLRMPHVQQHSNDLLNLSYVFTASNRFMDTLQSVVKALNRAGFSEHDYRDATLANPTSPPINLELFEATVNQEPMVTPVIAPVVSEVEIDLGNVSPNWESAQEGPSDSFVEQVKQKALEENGKFEAAAQATDSLNTLPFELEDRTNRHRLKDVFRERVLSLKLPQFFIKVQTGGWFQEGDALQLLERDELLKGFKLSQADATINFEDVESEIYRVDLETIGPDDYTPRPFKVRAQERARLNEYILSGSSESQVHKLADRLFALIGNMYPITDHEVKYYIRRIVDSMSSDQIRDCLERDFSYVGKIKRKIDSLAGAHGLKAFIDLLDVDRITLQPYFTLPESISPSANAPALANSLYITEASMNNFERSIINDIANQESIEWWHRNLTRGKGFRINGYLNHFPDFILKTKSGRIVMLETKGDDRDNSDSELKLKLGKLWEAKAGGTFRYMMVFENNPIDGAERHSDALNKLAQL